MRCQYLPVTHFLANHHTGVDKVLYTLTWLHSVPDVYIISKFDFSIQNAIQPNTCTCSRRIGINGDRGEDLSDVRPEIGDRRLLEDLGRENCELPDARYD